MSGFKSFDTVKKNSKVWAQNLPKPKGNQKRIFPRIETLTDFIRLPLKKDILGLYITLSISEKSKENRIKTINSQLSDLWQKFSIPMLSKQAISARLKKLLTDYEKNQKYSKMDFEEALEDIFDITKFNGEWLNKEDKDFYLKQIESGGKVGYTTLKAGYIHPSKQKHTNSIFSNAFASTEIEKMEISSESSTESESSIYEDMNSQTKKFSTRIATKLVTNYSLSTHQASKVCTELSESGINLPTPSQSGIFKNVIRKGTSMKSSIKELLGKTNEYCMHFDGKRIMGCKGTKPQEYQVLCLQSSELEIKLGIVKCKSGSSEHIFNGICQIIDEYDAWNVIKMVICDTTAVNTGRHNGVVAKIEKKMFEMGLVAPQYIGCQHHILDRVLRHILDFYLEKFTCGPNLNYKFIEEILENYNELKASYIKEIDMDEVTNLGWRDDFKYLYTLCNAFKLFKESGKQPNIEWKPLPSIHSARWNSRAIYALLAYFLLPKWREVLEIPVSFIAFGWQKAWFSNQKFDPDIYNHILSHVRKTNCQTAEKCLKTHWSQEISTIDIPRTNIVAERAIKLMQDIIQNSKSDKYINEKFITKNNF